MLTLDKSKKIFCWLWTSSKLNRQQNSLGRNWMPELFFLNAFLTQLGYLWLPTPHYAAPMWLTGHYATPLVTRYFPTQPLPREAEDFPRGGNHSKHMPLLTYLAWLQPIYYNPKFVFLRVNTAKILPVVKTLIKNIEHQPH